MNCTQPPPGGAEQYEAIDSARQRKCSDSVDAVQRGMKKSIDHCTLYRQAWLCFNEAHQRPLEDVAVKSWEDLVLHIPHFEGAREERKTQAETVPELKNMPLVYQPATDGIEFRMESWTADEEMQERVADLFGEPTVADHLAKDMHLVGLAAAGLAATPPKERTGATEEAWARRVWVLCHGLHGPVGAVIDKHRKDLMPVLRSLLVLSTTDYVDARGYRTPIPSSVREAHEVCIGNRPIPSTFKPAATRTDGFEPEIPDDEGEVGIRGTERR